MKRVAVFALLGPVLFGLCVWFLFLPFASLMEDGPVRYDIEVDSYLVLLLGLMVCGLALALADWFAEMMVLRPWFTGLVGFVFGALALWTVFNLSAPTWWWFIVKGLLVGIPALVCSWLVKRMRSRKAQ